MADHKMRFLVFNVKAHLFSLRVVKEALRERYARIKRQKGKASVEELLAIADRAAVHVKHPYLDHGQLLYDENGLPK